MFARKRKKKKKRSGRKKGQSKKKKQRSNANFVKLGPKTVPQSSMIDVTRFFYPTVNHRTNVDTSKRRWIKNAVRIETQIRKKKKKEKRKKVNKKKKRRKKNSRQTVAKSGSESFPVYKLETPPNPVWNQIWQPARRAKGENGGKKNKTRIKVELNAGKGFEMGGETRTRKLFLIHPWLIRGDGLIFTISRSLTTLKSRAAHRLIDTKRGEVPLTDSFPSVQGLNAEHDEYFTDRSISPPLFSVLSLFLSRGARGRR